MRVEPATADWAEALAQADDVYTRRFGLPVVPGWCGFPETVPLLLSATRHDTPADWGPHLIFDDEGALVGTCGWKGQPVDGAVELGYAVAPARRNRGIATAVVTELLRRARAASVRLVVAHTLAEESASTTVLRRYGFTKAAEIADPDDGPMWRWELTFTQP